MTTSTMKREVFPRLPLLAVFALLTVTVVGAFVGRIGHVGANMPTARLVAERDLRFIDRDDGAVVVESGRDNHEIAVFTGEQGFLRGAMRGFVRTRHLAEIGPEQPFRLSRWSDGRLTLDDPATGQHVELLAFGPTNAGVFAPLLERDGPASRSSSSLSGSAIQTSGDAAFGHRAPLEKD